jgi:sulfane dehydrogenase subunit SoxC
MFSSEPLQVTAQALHGLVSNAEWTGVLLSTLLEETGIDPKATWLLAEGADSPALHRSVPIKKALDDAMIALYQNGERIQPGNGYPMRLLLPGYQGNMNVKYVRRIKLIDQPAHELLRVQDLLADSAQRQNVAVPLHAGGQILHHPSLLRPRNEGTWLL